MTKYYSHVITTNKYIVNKYDRSKKQAIDVHRHFFKKGLLLEAYRVYRGLLLGSFKLYLSDVDWNIQAELDRREIPYSYVDTRRGNWQEYYIRD